MIKRNPIVKISNIPADLVKFAQSIFADQRVVEVKAALASQGMLILLAGEPTMLASGDWFLIRVDGLPPAESIPRTLIDFKRLPAARRRKKE